MSNSLLTPTQVTREALRILHANLNFVGSIDRQYDSQFARSGAKIGSSLKIRKPNAYTVRTGATMNVQDTAEDSATLTLATQRGVDMAFSSVDLTLSLDDFSKRILKPAMSVLATNIEADALSMYKDVAQEISDVGATATTALVMGVKQRLTEALAPQSDRCLLLTPQANNALVSANVALFNPQSDISSQYRSGMIGNNFYGFETVYENTVLPLHTTGTEAGADTGANFASISADGATLTVDGTVTGTFKQGDIITIANVYDVHWETKTARASLKQFTVTADVATSYSTIPISPALISSGAKQNVNAAPVAGAAINKTESDDATAIAGSADYYINLGYHKDAFTFVTADLEMPKGLHFAAREVFDGISMRVLSDYDIVNDIFATRIDVLYGYLAQRPELACRLGIN